jgi:hypothetical protein
MRDLQKIGGVAALIVAMTVVVGLGMFATLLTDYTTGDPTTGESVTFLAENETTIFVWNLITLIGFSLALVPVALALNERLKAGAPTLARTATAFALIWSGLLVAGGMILNVASATIVDLSATDSEQAESLWLAVDTVANGLTGGMEIVGSIWVLLAGMAGLRSEALPRPLSYLAIVMALAGLVTVIPALEVVGAVFGLGLIVWFTWLGVIMLRQPEAEPNSHRSDRSVPSEQA